MAKQNNESLVILQEKLTELESLCLEIPKNRNVTCAIEDCEEGQNNTKILKPRFSLPYSPLSSQLSEKFLNFKERLADLLRDQYLEHFILLLDEKLQYKPIVESNFDNFTYKGSLYALLERDVYFTHDIYGDYLIENMIVEDTVKCSISLTRRGDKRSILGDGLEFDTVESLQQFVMDHALKQISLQIQKHFKSFAHIFEYLDTLDSSSELLVNGPYAQKYIDRICEQFESHKLDFKEVWPKQSHDIAKLISAFSNHDGGDIYFGISDLPHEITGISDFQNIEERISGLRNLDPFPPIKYICYTLENDLKVLRLHISPADLPVNYKGIFYFRDPSSSSTRYLSSLELKSKFLKKPNLMNFAVQLTNHKEVLNDQILYRNYSSKNRYSKLQKIYAGSPLSNIFNIIGLKISNKSKFVIHNIRAVLKFPEEITVFCRDDFGGYITLENYSSLSEQDKHHFIDIKNERTSVKYYLKTLSNHDSFITHRVFVLFPKEECEYPLELEIVGDNIEMERYSFNIQIKLKEIEKIEYYEPMKIFMLTEM